MTVTQEERIASLEERISLNEARTLANYKMLRAISETQSEHTKTLREIDEMVTDHGAMLGEIIAILKGSQS